MSGPGEQQPLLSFPYGEDSEPTERPKGTLAVWRENVSCVLESQRFHTFVIALVSNRCHIFPLLVDMQHCSRL
jgi:hypothetical protein